jgi:hypothetical protein
MEALRLFIDTHDHAKGSLPEGLDAEQLRQFLPQYEAACRTEGVVLLKVAVGLPEGRAFCMTLAPDAEAVKRAHARVGLPFDSITEVTTAGPAMFV